MPVIKFLGKMIKEFDLFPNPQLLRYNGDPDYKTKMGGLISISVIGILVFLFFNMAVKTATKQIITSKGANWNEVDPSETKLKMGPSGDMMFAVSFSGQTYENLSRAFNIQIKEENYTSGSFMPSVSSVNMVQCTPDHFNFNEQISRFFVGMNLQEAYCPPLNHQFTVKGKASSDIFKQFRVFISRCVYSGNSSCLNDTQYNSTYPQGQFIVDIPIVQFNINAGSQRYKEIYVQDQNYFWLSGKLGVSSTVSLETTTIDTDISIMPYTEQKIQNITRVTKTFHKDYFILTGGVPYSEIVFKKSSQVTQYTRSFNKVDTYLSYVGGLVGTIVTLFFFMGKYTQKAYEVSLCKKVLVDNQSRRIPSESFNIFYFFSYYAKFLLNTLGCQPNWPQTQQFEDGADAITNQLDITYILRKLDFLDVAVARLLPQHEIKTIYMRSKPTFNKANHQRKMHFAPQLIHQAQQNLNRSAGKNAVAPSDEGELGQVPTSSKREGTGLEKQLEKQLDNISAIELSHKEIDLKNIKDSVMQVVQDYNRGKSKSKKLIEGIDPEAFKELERIKQNEEANNKTMMIVENLDSDFITENSANQLHKEGKQRSIEKEFNI